MNSLIFAAFSRILFSVMLVVSVYVLYRGHNEPGGGFVGGLIAAAGFATLALARGVEVARATLRFEPMTVIGFGILAALLSGLPGLWLDGSFLTHQWLVLGNFHLGTTLLFDIGVYLVVLGGILSLILRFYEDL
ncbi:Na(+)/H(+) antiporter subunit B [Stutzerimonas stutzeri]|jgi:multicomponent Na+:H+ antiporter subunit B|uniref:Monovalent cation/proton antiporter subunit, putative n=1 Tax=Stutzerimonas stutzeri (strain A1501) TaxID=379731 RepID=A4VS79_STUS1|nr:Na(+)/H(+) antiporter subunit B [Stutzerimonas stutzeri]OHC23443.1 MAG: Na(+)/H(+) antiporter subunit B [Pseudomonadales bacterium RIFCSPHIGHO2_01_FULL_64_12]HAB86111.1 Na(+)/H(+) antiporter subunit B [Pseudomonas sp.]ABP81830.1 monovalent cation/proton antiporter subunit, putative [Stutzerimonas stutzeri A1501]AWK99622.1 Na(+)/H(+) antiporter subunit B [Stutzerimonas stutzeri]MDH0424259.1 Na(+)/H(+) antiporter subunit B [Stutzerimonas stutzeri]